MEALAVAHRQGRVSKSLGFLAEGVKVLQILHFEASLDASSLRSDVISSKQMIFLDD